MLSSLASKGYDLIQRFQGENSSEYLEFNYFTSYTTALEAVKNEIDQFILDKQYIDNIIKKFENCELYLEQIDNISFRAIEIIVYNDQKDRQPDNRKIRVFGQKMFADGQKLDGANGHDVFEIDESDETATLIQQHIRSMICSKELSKHIAGRLISFCSKGKSKAFVAKQIFTVIKDLLNEDAMVAKAIEIYLFCFLARSTIREQFQFNEFTSNIISNTNLWQYREGLMAFALSLTCSDINKAKQFYITAFRSDSTFWPALLSTDREKICIKYFKFCARCLFWNEKIRDKLGDEIEKIMQFCLANCPINGQQKLIIESFEILNKYSLIKLSNSCKMLIEFLTNPLCEIHVCDAEFFAELLDKTISNLLKGIEQENERNFKNEAVSLTQTLIENFKLKFLDEIVSGRQIEKLFNQLEKLAKGLQIYASEKSAFEAIGKLVKQKITDEEDMISKIKKNIKDQNSEYFSISPNQEKIFICSFFNYLDKCAHKYKNKKYLKNTDKDMLFIIENWIKLGLDCFRRQKAVRDEFKQIRNQILLKRFEKSFCGINRREQMRKLQYFLEHTWDEYYGHHLRVATLDYVTEDDLDEISHIGEGSVGTVSLVKAPGYVLPIVAKKIKDWHKDIREKIIIELDTLSKFRRHMHILHIFSIIQSKEGEIVGILIERCNCTLREIKFFNNNGFDLSLAGYYCSQIACGLLFLHDNDYIHGDIKPENILICKTETDHIVKVADVGLSKLDIKPVKSVPSSQPKLMSSIRKMRLKPKPLHEIPTSYEFGTEGYRAPEHRVSRAADIFAFGCLMYSISRSDKVIVHPYNEVVKKNPPSDKNSYERLMKKMMIFEPPTERPVIKNVFNDFENMKKDYPLSNGGPGQSLFNPDTTNT